MHQALQIVDILFDIFQHLVSDEKTCGERQTVNRRALSRATRVCKIFESLALDALWAYIDDIQNLLRVLLTLRKPGLRTYVGIL